MKKQEIQESIKKQNEVILDKRKSERNRVNEMIDNMDSMVQEYRVKVESIKSGVKSNHQWDDWEKMINGINNRLNQEQLSQQSQYSKYMKLVEEQDLVIQNQQKQLQMQNSKYEENNKMNVQQISELKEQL